MSDLFIPGAINKGNLEELLNPKDRAWDLPDEVLIYASASDIFLLKSFKDEPILLSEGRDITVQGLALHNGTLFDCGDYGIYETLSKAPLYDKEGVNAICSFDDRFFFAPRNSGGKVVELYSGNIFGWFESDVLGMAASDDYLYVCNEQGVKKAAVKGKSHFYTVKDSVYMEPCNDLCYQDGIIFAAVPTYGLWSTVMNVSYDEIVAKRDDCFISCLFSFGGTLYDCDVKGKIYNSVSDELVYSVDKSINFVLPVKKEIVEGFAYV